MSGEMPKHFWKGDQQGNVPESSRPKTSDSLRNTFSEGTTSKGHASNRTKTSFFGKSLNKFLHPSSSRTAAAIELSSSEDEDESSNRRAEPYAYENHMTEARANIGALVKFYGTSDVRGVLANNAMEALTNDNLLDTASHLRKLGELQKKDSILEKQRIGIDAQHNVLEAHILAHPQEQSPDFYAAKASYFMDRLLISYKQTGDKHRHSEIVEAAQKTWHSKGPRDAYEMLEGLRHAQSAERVPHDERNLRHTIQSALLKQAEIPHIEIHAPSDDS